MACHRGRGSGCSRPGFGISPLAGGHHLPHHRISRPYIGLGIQTVRGHRQNLVHTRTQEKGAVTLRETALDLPMSVQECNCAAIALISHASKVMLKILQTRLQQYVNRELPNV